EEGESPANAGDDYADPGYADDYDAGDHAGAEHVDRTETVVEREIVSPGARGACARTRKRVMKTPIEIGVCFLRGCSESGTPPSVLPEACGSARGGECRCGRPNCSIEIRTSNHWGDISD